MHPAKFLILAGLVLLLVGTVWYVAGWGPFSRLGRLPGDITIERRNWSVYIPITTSILLSVVLTVLLTLLITLFRR